MRYGGKLMILVAVLLVSPELNKAYEPSPDVGYSAGLLPDCPGVTKNATIKPESLPLLKLVLQSLSDSGEVIRKVLPLASANKIMAKHKYIDLKKKTVVYACGFLDSSVFPHTQAIANTYAKRGYNVLVTETFSFYTYIYPKSVRISRVIGKMLGEFLVKLTKQGLDPDKLELIGVSLGAHTMAFAAKHFFSVTGKKPLRLTGLDPSGPCFRSSPPEEKLDASDAQRVDVMHTNIDGFGIAQKLGHVDFYVNGGEYQPGDIPYIPCLVICSHLRSVIYYWIALENPKKFIAMQCDSIQDARLAKCYDSPVTNYLGLETNFTRPGIYYLPTNNEFPYYRGKDGLNANNEIYKKVAGNINADDVFEA